MAEKRTERFHWGWIISSAALGLALLGFAHVTALAWHWPDVTTGVISSVGATFLLAFVLFLFERRFTRSVAERVKDATEAVVTARTEELGVRLDDLEARLNARRAEAATVQDDAVAAIAEDVSFDTISTALAESERVGAIRNGALTVPGSSHEPRLAIEFQFATKTSTRGDGVVLDDGTVPRLTVRVHFPRRVNQAWSPVILADWSPDVLSDEIGSELETELQRRDRLAEAKVFDFPLALRNLQKGLALALSAQRAPVGQELLHGILFEVVTDEWAITSAGVEDFQTGLLVPQESLGFGAAWGRGGEPSKPVAAPERVEQGTWDYILARAGKQPAPNIFG